MKGDFSKWVNIPKNNEQGVLYQQGRVMNDADLTGAERIAWHWRSEAGRDVIGAGVAAVPAAESGGFKIVAAAIDGADVKLKITPGRVWADGLLLYLAADPAQPQAPLIRTAHYLPPPLNPAGTDTGDIGDDVRDMVVLEIAMEALNGFQDPPRLIEKALGGPDTAERMIANLSLALLRLDDEEHCDNVQERLRDDATGKGKLTVTLEEPEEITGECPVVAGGGYTGFEHNLYRIEIAAMNGAVAPHFKWSAFNGGLVGRGVFHNGVDRHVEIRANRTAIINSGLIDLYLEAVQYDTELGAWRVTYGTTAHLNSDHELDLDHPPTFGAFPGTSAPVFFRLWNGLVPVADFTGTEPLPFRDGIQLQFDTPGAGARYRPGDYWIFSVRAGGIANPQVLIDAQPPEGLILRRVPLAEIQWTGDKDTDVSGIILDCRRRFRPLSNQKVCCSLQVGDGISTFGDFNSIEEAAAHLPSSGGELCLLPGIHFTNLVLTERTDIHIRGCAKRTLVMPHAKAPDAPIFQIIHGRGIRLSSMDLFAPFGSAVIAGGTTLDPLKDFRVDDCRILALTYAVHVEQSEFVQIDHNQMWLLDLPQGRSAISARIRQGLIERNRIGVWPYKLQPPDDGGDGEQPPDPNDDCLTPEEVYDNLTLIVGYLIFIWQNHVNVPPPQPYRAIGGIHLRGGCDTVRVLENNIDGGAGHGIILGGLLPGEEESDGGDKEPVIAVGREQFYALIADEAKNPVKTADLYLSRDGAVNASGISDDTGLVQLDVQPASYSVALPGYQILSIAQSTLDDAVIHQLTVAPAKRTVSLDRASLYRITIQENTITRMAVCGIGFMPFLQGQMDIALPDPKDPEAAAAFLAAFLAPKELVLTCNVVRELVINNNHIHHNLIAVFNEVLRALVKLVGLGGISLALVENSEITDNHIESNGVSAANPSCGIFIGYGEDIEISRNQINGNGPLTPTYDTDRIQGIRGGVFVRLANAVLLGGEYDRLQKPALSIRDNHIDQPAGRAITAFAFGPVNCVGNFLNSEREGFFTFMDELVGTVQIVNMGGIHRHMSFKQTKGKALPDETFAAPVRAADFQDIRLVELLLPGGETLVNSNQVRFGPDHKALTSQLLVSLDDVGVDGNQSSVFRPDLLFANTIAIGNSLRVTDNRFRENTVLCPYSLLSVALGLSVLARTLTMNTTMQNQGEHCIVAMSNGPVAQVLDEYNIELLPLCSKIGESQDSKQAYFVKALLAVLLARSSLFKTQEAAEQSVETGTLQSYGAMQTLQMNYQRRQSEEAVRVQHVYGEQAPDAVMLRRRVLHQGQATESLRIQIQLINVPQVEDPAEGKVFDGRVTDERYLGLKGLTVELVEGQGKALLSAKTDASGYYATTVDPQLLKRLQGIKKVFVRVTDARGQELFRDKTPLDLTQPRLRTNIIVPRKSPVIGRPRDEIFTRPTEPVKPVETQPVESIPGVTAAITEKLRGHGIDTVDKLIKTPNIRLAEITGRYAEDLKRSARLLLKSGPKAPTPPQGEQPVEEKPDTEPPRPTPPGGGGRKTKRTVKKKTPGKKR